MVADHVAKRRANMLAVVRKVSGLTAPDELVLTGEAHVCQLLLELHQRGPLPEDHFSWLVDQYMARCVEAQHPRLAAQAFAILGPVPSTRADYAVVAASAVWARYEADHKSYEGASDKGPRARSHSPSSSEEESAEKSTANGQGRA